MGGPLLRWLKGCINSCATTCWSSALLGCLPAEGLKDGSRRASWWPSGCEWLLPPRPPESSGCCRKEVLPGGRLVGRCKGRFISSTDTLNRRARVSAEGWPPLTGGFGALTVAVDELMVTMGSSWPSHLAIVL